MSTNHASNHQTVVVTGSSRGIGNHLSFRFLDEGYDVIGISRSETNIDHPRFRSLTADLADLDQVKGLSEQLSGQPIAGLINNAGIHGPIGPFDSVSIDDWVHTFSVNLFGGAALTQFCIPSLRQHKGFIIFLSGGGSAVPRPNFSPYGISKTAIVRFSEVLAKELAPEVLVYCVAPGPNPTQLLEEAIRGGEVVPEGGLVEFGKIERLCLFLAHNVDSRYSGKFIHVMDDYEHWDEWQLAPDAHTLRRMDARTLGRIEAT